LLNWRLGWAPLCPAQAEATFAHSQGRRLAVLSWQWCKTTTDALKLLDDFVTARRLPAAIFFNAGLHMMTKSFSQARMAAEMGTLAKRCSFVLDTFGSAW